MDTQPDQLEPSPVSEPAPVKESTGSKRDFWIGFLGWWVVNLCAYGSLFGINLLIGASQITGDWSSIFGTISNGVGCLLLLANVGALIFFAFRRKQIALGILVAFGVSIAISILLGIIAMIACFVILGQYNNL